MVGLARLKSSRFYTAWSVNGTATPQAKAVSAFLKNVSADGLDPADYPIPEFQDGLSADQVAANDLRLTDSVITYVRHVCSGRVSFTRVSGAILYLPHAPDPKEVLARVSTADDVSQVLGAFSPPQPEYKALKAQLERERNAASGGGQGSSETARSYKPRDSSIGHAAKINTIVANMERWRWIPRDLGNAYVIVNIPNYTLQLVSNGNVMWATKIVAGKPGDMATPLLSETMKYLTINPTRNVPPSIIRNEYLPALQRDPDALERVGLKVGRNNDGSIRVYQPPGARNALGRIRFNFPNPFLVYQHDTPNKNLFALDRRALSHGCMRVQNPEKYAEALLSVSQAKEGISAARIRQCTEMKSVQSRSSTRYRFM